MERVDAGLLVMRCRLMDDGGTGSAEMIVHGAGGIARGISAAIGIVLCDGGSCSPFVVARAWVLVSVEVALVPDLSQARLRLCFERILLLSQLWTASQTLVLYRF